MNAVLMRELGVYLERSCGAFRVYATETLTDLPVEDLGFFSLHFPASRISTLGADPKLILGTFLLPKDRFSDLKIVEEMEEEAKRYRLESAARVAEARLGEGPIASAVIVGEARDLMLPVNVRAGDIIALIGVPGADFLYLIASKRPDLVEKADLGDNLSKWKRCRWMLTCLDAARTIPSVAKVSGMICVGESGILGSLTLLSKLSGMGFVIWRDRIEFPPELVEISHHMGLDPLSVPSRGAVLAILPKDSPTDKIGEILDAHGYRMSLIGSLRTGGGRIVEDGRIRELSLDPPDARRPCSRF